MLLVKNNGTFSGRVIDKTTSESPDWRKYFFKERHVIRCCLATLMVTSLYQYHKATMFCCFIYWYEIANGSSKIVTDSTTNINFEMTSFSTNFEEIVVRAGKFDKSIEDQTSSIEIMSPRLIDAKNTESVETILNMVPGLNILDEEPQIRGGSGFTFWSRQQSCSFRR